MQVLDNVAVEAGLRLEGAYGEEALEEFLEGVRRHFELAQICYTRSPVPGPGQAAMAISLIHGGRSFPPVRDARLVFLEALLTAHARGRVPLDWAALAKRDPKLRRLRDEARDAGLGRQGLTIPVFGGKGVCALFSVTADESDAVWSDRWFELSRDLLRIAYFVDQWACGQSAADGQDRIHPGQGDPAGLGPREREALQWAAEGRRPAEIAAAMRASPSVVEALLESARYKLKALNGTHAIVKALRAGLIR